MSDSVFGILNVEFRFDFKTKIGADEMLIFVFPNFSVCKTRNFRNFAAFTTKLRKEKIYAILRRRKRGSISLPY